MIRKIHPLVLSVLILSVVSMNLLANKELFRTDWIALDCGFILSWIPFLIMDAICKAFGGKTAAAVSLLAIGINLAVFGIFKLVSLAPGMWGAYYDTGSVEVNDALNRTIGGSSWIVLASAMAMSVSSVTNSAINISVSKFLRKDTYATFAIRSFVSTVISQFIDNFIFAVTVSVTLFGWSMKQALVCSATAALFELAMEIIFSGFGYKLSEKLKQ